QSAFADTASAEDAHALSFAAGQERIDRANSGDDWLRDVLSIHGAAGRLIQAIFRGGPDSRAAVDRTAQTVPNAADEFGTNRKAGIVLSGGDPIAELDSVYFFEGQREDKPVPKPNHLCPNPPARGCADFAEIPDGNRRTSRCD